MELVIGDLVSHKIHKDVLGYAIIISPIKEVHKNLYVCSVQWVRSGKIHLMDIDLLKKEGGGKNVSF